MFARKQNMWTLVAVTLVAAGLVYVRAADVAQDDAAGAKALASAAENTFTESLKQLSAGYAQTPDECYLWSRRVMDAESRDDKGNSLARLDAATAHEKRMHDLDRVWSALVTAGERKSTGATEFYILEAKEIESKAVHGK